MSTSPSPTTRLVQFRGGTLGPWIVSRQSCLVGEPLPIAERMAIAGGDAIGANATPELSAIAWDLHGVTSNERYVTRPEKTALVERQQGLGRAGASHAAMIAIRKTRAWWSLTQDERRSIFEAQSKHVEIGMKYLPAVARRLHHCRDLVPDEPFDFLTWFEFAPEHAGAFDEMLVALRASPEWTYIDREVDVRLVLEGAHCAV